MLLKTLLILIVLYLFYRVTVYKKRQVSQANSKKYRDQFSHSFETKQFRCRLAHDTPTNCILRDNKYYGENFKDKIPPTLCINCLCEYVQKDIRSFDNFTAAPQNPKKMSDLGELSPDEYKYYRFYILSTRDDVDVEQRRYFSESLDNINVPPPFKHAVQSAVLSRTQKT